MLVKRVLPLICLAGVVVCGLSFSTAAPGMEKSSEAMLAPSHEQVQSILNSNCLSCHNSEKRTGGFSVADLESVLEGGAKHGPAVIAGRPAESPLVQILRGEIEPQMPFGASEALADSDIAVIERWIGGLKPETADSDSDTHWAFVKPVWHDPPAVQNGQWVRNEIDNFILGKLEEKGLVPAEEADRRVLIRRLYFDLIGLPPLPEEVQAFVESSSPKAYEELVDRLLAKPGYGERWARHWLDLARYADSNGYEQDPDYYHTWRYRDYVIDTFNNDKPYNEFIKEQLAGDEFLHYQGAAALPTPDPENVVALTFLRLAPFTEPRGERSRDELLSEMTTTVSSVFLGLTVGCAKCHDHKYDPIPQEDFYRMKAFFATVYMTPPRVGDVQQLGGPQPAEFYRPGEKEWADENRAKHENELESVEAEYEAFQKPLLEMLAAFRGQPENQALEELREQEKKLERGIESLREEMARHVSLYLDGQLEAAELGEKETLIDRRITVVRVNLKGVRAELEELAAEQNKGAAKLGDLATALKQEATKEENELFSADERDRYFDYRSRILWLENRIERLKPLAMSVQHSQGPPYAPSAPETYVLDRGEFDRPGKPVKPGFPRTIAGHSEPAVLELDRFRRYPTRGWRITLARWIASAANPLTARVMVNRIWQHHFGQGIVATPSDFGKIGARPTHPELLDWLAIRFIEEKWSIKAIHRLILTSSTYRQSSQKVDAESEKIDPENELLSRFNRWRLEGELVRDSVLAVSGRLNRDWGGPPVFPPLPVDLLEKQNVQGLNTWDTTHGPEGRKRSIYTYQRRSLNNPFLGVFDAPVFNTSCDRRKISITPLQALSMYDGQFVNEEASHFAQRVRQEASPEPNEQITRAFQLAFSRSPRPAELQQAQEFFTSAASHQEALVGLCRVLLNTNEFLYVD